MRAPVDAGVGVIRSELAIETQAGGELPLFGDHKPTTNPPFVHPEDHKSDPTSGAVLAALKKTWSIAG